MFHGKCKAVTFSYDDGVSQDVRLIALLDKYGLKATFNLNSGMFGACCNLTVKGETVTHNLLSAEEAKKLYVGHEVAVHTLTHPNLTTLPDQEVIRQVKNDRENLSKLFGYEVYGMAYPMRRRQQRRPRGGGHPTGHAHKIRAHDHVKLQL